MYNFLLHYYLNPSYSKLLTIISKWPCQSLARGGSPCQSLPYLPGPGTLSNHRAPPPGCLASSTTRNAGGWAKRHLAFHLWHNQRSKPSWYGTCQVGSEVPWHSGLSLLPSRGMQAALDVRQVEWRPENFTGWPELISITQNSLMDFSRHTRMQRLFWET